MSVLGVGEGSPLIMDGDAWLRGAKQAAAKDVSRDQILTATVGRVERARADGLIGTEQQAYLDAQKAFAEENDPYSMAELAGIAASARSSLASLRLRSGSHGHGPPPCEMK